MVMKSASLLLSILFLTHCASDEKHQGPPDMPVGEDVHYGAYAADGFTFYTPDPEHDDPRPIIFYHKYCTLADFGGDFIGNQYDCDDLNR